MDDSDNCRPGFRFGPFELYVEQGLLLRDGSGVALAGKSVALLAALVEHAGTTLSAEALIALVWPGRVIDEGNIRVHINRLRNVLDDGAQERSCIQTVPLRGYAFVGAVRRMTAPHTVSTITPAPDTGVEGLPLPLAPLYGRETDLAEIERQLLAQRLVTVVGPGGVGKTALALVAARALASHCSQRAVYVDLALLGGGDEVLTAIAAACDFPATLAPVTTAALSGWLSGRPTLLVLDHCGWLIDNAAACCTALLRSASELRILAVSREPLRIHGEWVKRLAPLALPGPNGGRRLTALEVRGHAAPRLFVDLISGHLGGYQLSDADAPLVADICRRLDGLPLAIELAAGMVEQLGLQALAAGLTDSLALLVRGRRSADPRHRSLRTSLDWSFERLPRAEQRILLSLATFSADFTPACCGAAGGADVADLIGNLVLKSWILADTSATMVRYRLSNIIRIYLRERAAAAMATVAITPAARVLGMPAASAKPVVPAPGHAPRQPDYRHGEAA